MRVPFDLDESRREGMEVPTWIREQIVDTVIVASAGGGWNYRLPIEAYTELAAGTTCKIVAQNLDGFREGGQRSAKVLFGEGDYYSAEMHRAVAARHWEAGADGIYIWNQDWIKFAKDDRFDPQSWREIGDPDVLSSAPQRPKAALRVLVEQLTSLDDVRFELNEAHLDAASATRRYNYDDCWLDFPVTDLLRKGWNDLSLTVEERNPHVDAPLVVRSAKP
ncbi:MAG: hypothetical protein CME13_07695 [Gemmatimonadetes bacterium]|nr:hypothetical protein [Gemmatimonadota bacterium]